MGDFDLGLEIELDNGLQPCQLLALCRIRESARIQHVAALPRLRERVRLLGFLPDDADLTLEWIKKQAPIIIPVDLEKVGSKLSEDTHFRNELELESCDPVEELRRVELEHALFEGAYQGVLPSLRCKYGVVSVAHEPSSVQSTRGLGSGDCLVLRNVRHRTTFLAHGSAMLGTIDYYAHMLEEYTTNELRTAVRVATRRSLAGDTGVIEHLKEAHIHGDVKLAENIGSVVVNAKLRPRGVTEMLEKLADRCQAPLVCMKDFPPPPSSRKKNEKKGSGRTSLSLPESGSSCSTLASVSPSSADDELQRALELSIQCAEDERRAHAQEKEDFARAIGLSTCYARHPPPAERDMRAMVVDSSILAASGASSRPSPKYGLPVEVVLPFGSMGSTVAIDAGALGGKDEVVSMLKACLGDDVRRFRLSWPCAAGSAEIFTVIDSSVRTSFDLVTNEYCLKYEDEDGDLCTLVKATVADYVSSRVGPTLKKLLVHCASQQEVKEMLEAPAEVSQPQAEEDEATKMQEPFNSASEGPDVDEFSMVTPPVSPRGQSPAGDFRRASSIEDDYDDDSGLWTFVAEASVHVSE